MVKQQKPPKEQLGFDFGPISPDNRTTPLAKGTTHVSEPDRGLSDPLPARLEGGADRGGEHAGVHQHPSPGDDREPQPDHGTVADSHPQYEPDPARTGSRSNGARALLDVHGNGLDPNSARGSELQQAGLFGVPAAQSHTSRVVRRPRPAAPSATDGQLTFSFSPAATVLERPERHSHSDLSNPTDNRQPDHRFRLDDSITQPSGLKANAEMTLAALRLLKTLEADNRAATLDEKRTLAGFSGFGALANHIFPEPGTQSYKAGWQALGQELAELLTLAEYASAKRSTFNAFYTSPKVMQAMYDGLARMGVLGSGTNVLEPGCGIGNFMGMAPSGMRFIGVEQETLSGHIAQAIYPEHDVRIAPFQKVDLPAGSVDVVIGNVPFSDLSLKWQERKLPLHEYFFAKSLDALREDGILALITSRYTMDKQDPSFREYLAEEADLLGAIRLPKGAFRNEGTEVVTDIIFLTKRAPAKVPNHAADWLQTEPLPNQQAHCNRYFLEHPEMVIGTLAQTRGMYRNHELTVTFPDDFEHRLQNAVARLPQDTYRSSENTPLRANTETPLSNSVRRLPPGSLLVGEDGYICQVTNQSGATEPLTRGGNPIHGLTGTVGTRLAALIEIRDAARTVLDTQREGEPVAARDAARAQLNRQYDRFAARFGAINKTNVSIATNGTTIRRQPNLTSFKDDPDAYLVMALEQYDEKTDTAKKMPIMQRDVIGQTPPVHQVGNALDGLLVSLNHRGRVDVAYISKLYGATQNQVIEELGNHVYYDPAKEYYVTAEEYLSGNVREKLRIAHNQTDTPNIARNVDALCGAQPAPVPPGDIDVALGASWIPSDVIQAFVADLLQCALDDIKVHHVEKEALWHVDGSAWVKGKVESTNTYGTSSRPALSLINDALNMRVPTVTTTISVDGAERQVPDQEATLAAREKQKAIKQRFQQWLFEEPERADGLTERYNQTFNTTTLRSYNGSHLTFPDMNPDIELHQHQKDAVWRVMNSNNALLAHAVGAGKTFEMIAAGVKMKETGLIRKPLYVVPNHMLAQFSKEFYTLYPDAKLLVASKDDLKKEKRMLMTAKAASGEWDGIIMTHSSFEKIGMSPEFQSGFVRQQIDEYETLLTDMNSHADADSKRLIKRIEKKKEQWEQRLDDLLNEENKDRGLTFEDLGVDHLFVDEAHLFKNLETPTKMGQVAGVQTTGSLRAFDLFMKTRYLDRDGHGTTFATGTPVQQQHGGDVHHEPLSGPRDAARARHCPL